MERVIRIRDRIANYQQLKPQDISEQQKEHLKEEFASEHLEVWTTASLVIGRLAAQGDKDLKQFLQQKLLNYSNIHKQRHAITALGSYYRYCDDPEEELMFLKQYRNYTFNLDPEEIDEQEIQEKIPIKTFFETIFNQVQDYAALKQLLKGERKVKTEQDNKILTQAIKNQQDHLPIVIASLRNNFAEYIDADDDFEQANSYQQLLNLLAQELDELDGEDLVEYVYEHQNDYNNNLAVYYHRERLMEKMLQQEEISPAERNKFDLRINFGLINSRFPITWYISNVVNCLAELYHTELPVFSFAKDLCAAGVDDHEYIANLPHFLYVMFEETELSQRESNLVVEIVDLLGQTIEENINNNSGQAIEAMHNGDLLLGINYLYQEVKGTDFLTTVVLPKGIIEEEVLHQYQRLNSINEPYLREKEAVNLLLEIKKKFTAELEWKSKDDKVQKTKYVFDMIIKNDSFGIDLEKKIKIVLAGIKDLKYKNKSLLNLLLRELKFLYFNFLQEVDGNSDIVDRIWFEIYSLIELVEEWNWPGTINKDLASILINTFDLLWSKGEYKELFKAIFMVFNYVPEQRIVEEMLQYSKNHEVEKILSSYKKHTEFSYTDSDKQVYLQQLIDDEELLEQLPREINLIYQLLNQLTLEKEIGSEVINIFDIQMQLKHKKQLQTDINQFELSQLNDENYNLFKKYFLEPQFRYGIYKEKEGLDYLNDSSQDEKEDIERKIDLQAREYLNQLKQLISGLNLARDKYINVFDNPDNYSNVEQISNELNNLLTDYRNLMDKLPVLERKYMFSTIQAAEEAIMTNKNYLVRINVACQNENEEELLTILREDLKKWEIIEELQTKFEDIICDNLLQRGMFEEYNQLFKDSKRFNMNTFSFSAWLNRIVTHPVVISLFFLFPAVIYYLGNLCFRGELGDRLVDFSVDVYLNYILGLEIIVFIVGIYLLFRLGAHWLLGDNNSRDSWLHKILGYILIPSDKRYKYKFFLPKLLGVIFVIYLNFALSDELLVLTYQVNFYLKLVLMVIYLAFVYYFLKMFQFGNLDIGKQDKRKRVRKIMSIGLFYSFIVNLLITLTYSHGLKLRNTVELGQVDKKLFEISAITHHLGDQIIDITNFLDQFLITKVVIMPELIIFGTIQMFFIAIILEFFLQQEKVINNN
ncbi:MAG: hypothetical protein ACQERJ_07110 [Bacillota bacterium]